MSPRHFQFRVDPGQFRELTGMTPPEFDSLVVEIGPRFLESERARHERRGRCRAIGGGPHFGLDLADQILLVLIRLRHRPTLAMLGDVFGVSIWTAMRVIRRITPILKAAGTGSNNPVRGGRDGDDFLRHISFAL